MSLFDDATVGMRPESTFTVTELGDAIGNALRAAFRDEVWVRGEIRDLSRPQSGHVYFTLCDPTSTGAGAQVSVMLHARQKPGVNATLTDAGGTVRMTAGTEVRIRGRVDWYGPRGQVQLRMTGIDPAFTLGQLELARAELLRRLDEEGLLRANADRPLPPAPLRIGLITSEGSAAEADFLDELRASGFAFRVLRADTRVQGVDAARSVAVALRMLGTHRPDAIAVVRGGGARTDLAAFDDEAVARAIATCPVPVLTGIGHETDTSVADEVAHTAAKTPTACAQLLVGRVAQVADQAESAWRAVAAHAGRALQGHDDALRDRGRVLARTTRQTLGSRAHRLDSVTDRCQQAARSVLVVARRRVDEHRGRAVGAARSHLRTAEVLVAAAERRVVHRSPRALAEAERTVAGIEALVRGLDPDRTLARGWSITRRADGTVVRHPRDVAAGDALTTQVRGGEVRSTVTETSTVSPDG